MIQIIAGRMVDVVECKGDEPGHPFRGNQYTGGSGGGAGESGGGGYDGEHTVQSTVYGDDGQRVSYRVRTASTSVSSITAKDSLLVDGSLVVVNTVKTNPQSGKVQIDGTTYTGSLTSRHVVMTHPSTHKVDKVVAEKWPDDDAWTRKK